MIETVTKGRVNRMPAWGDFLGEAKVHILTAYVWGLGGGVKPAAPVAVAEQPAAAAAAPKLSDVTH
jgi:cytochrome c oxidase cbb3-type subunit 3